MSGLNDFRDLILTEMWSHNNQKNEHAHSCVWCVISATHKCRYRVIISWVMSDEFWVISLKSILDLEQESANVWNHDKMRHFAVQVCHRKTQLPRMKVNET